VLPCQNHNGFRFETGQVFATAVRHENIIANMAGDRDLEEIFFVPIESSENEVLRVRALLKYLPSLEAKSG
jgi:hypothetical protein